MTIGVVFAIGLAFVLVILCVWSSRALGFIYRRHKQAPRIPAQEINHAVDSGRSSMKAKDLRPGMRIETDAGIEEVTFVLFPPYLSDRVQISTRTVSKFDRDLCSLTEADSLYYREELMTICEQQG